MSEKPSDPNVVFGGSIPESYERHLGPVIFAPYADDLVRRLLAAHSSGPVLETACGTGILTRRLHDALDPDVAITATDLNEAMIAHARDAVGVARRIVWRQADATNLPFDAGMFGAVVCQFGMMFMPDKNAAVREARRVLNRKGWFGFNVWCGWADNAFGRLAHETITGFFPSNPPTFYQIPFGWNDPKVIEGLLKANGFTRIELTRVTLEAVAESARHFAQGLVEGNPVVHSIRDARLNVAPIIDALAAALAKEGGDKPFRSPMHALVASAYAS
jgi:ubiquinone/menaquinone biosynthesis C-methylase UbiE